MQILVNEDDMTNALREVLSAALAKDTTKMTEAEYLLHRNQEAVYAAFKLGWYCGLDQGE